METEAQLEIHTSCPNCKQKQTIVVSRDGYNRWKAGEFIQEALPKLTADQREALMTGICPKCWDEMFVEEE